MQTVWQTQDRGHEKFRRDGFRCLQSIEERHLSAGQELAPQSPLHLEVLTYVAQGLLSHQDSQGNSTTVRNGEILRLRGEEGIQCFEKNALTDKETWIIQFCLQSSQENSRGESRMELKSFNDDFETKSVVLVASPDGEDGSITLNEDVYVHLARLKTGEERCFRIEPGRHVWVQGIHGDFVVNGSYISGFDAVTLSDETQVTIDSKSDTEFFVFDLP